MPEKSHYTPRYSAEVKAEAVGIARMGRDTMGSIAKAYKCSPETVCNWVAKDAGFATATAMRKHGVTLSWDAKLKIRENNMPPSASNGKEKSSTALPLVEKTLTMCPHCSGLISDPLAGDDE